MSGETERDESGWTVDQLRQHEYALRVADQRFDAERDRRLSEIAALREVHDREVGRLQEHAAMLEQRRIDERLAHLNENAQRTIEERGHFVTHEAFDPFRDAVLKAIAANTGGRQMIGYLVGVGGFVLAIVAFVRPR